MTCEAPRHLLVNAFVETNVGIILAMSDDVQRYETVNALRASGAKFALVFGSQARGTASPNSDLDVAAWWPFESPQQWELDLPSGVDLVDVERVPLELAGRIACEGVVLFDDSPAERVRWVATTRKIWLDERDRFQRSHRTFLEAAANG